MAERIVIRNTQSPGDFIVLSAALRDINRMYPGRYQFVVDVPEPSVYLHNPDVAITPRHGGRSLVAKYPLIHQSNQQRAHFIWGFLEYLNQQLGTRAVLSDFRPALYLSEEEMRTPLVKFDRPYWVFVSGGKRDYTAKWWDPVWWQTVVNRLKDRVVMVQVGGGSHVHPKLEGVHDNLLAKTSLRELMRLIYHSHGVMCIVTCLMHIAAAFNKPCITIAGGREPWWWEAYTDENRLVNMRRGQPNWVPPAGDDFIPHRYLHTIGQLDCCANQGCWKSKVEGVGSVCVEPVKQNNCVIPRCLQMITPDLVVANWQWYYDQKILDLGKSLGAGTMMPASRPDPLVSYVPSPPLTGVRQFVQPTGQLITVDLSAPPASAFTAAPPPLGPIRFRVYGYVDMTAANAEWFAAHLMERVPKLLTIVCNGYRPELDSFCRDKGLTLFQDAAMPGRIEMMQQAMTQLDQDWVIWLENPLLLARDWETRLSERFQGYTKAVGGLIHSTRLSSAQEGMLLASPWQRGKPFERSKINPTQFCVQHPERGFLVITRTLVREWGIPSGLPDSNMELLLGEGIRQYSLTLADVGEAIEA